MKQTKFRNNVIPLHRVEGQFFGMPVVRRWRKRLKAKIATDAIRYILVV